jgi:putative tryptophan/tyrosine transport system substrate-binding protein
MRRREFVGLIGGAAVAWPLAARAQQTSKPVIGVLSAGIRGAPQQLLYVALRAGLKESGYVEGENVAFEYRYADGRFDRLATFASELVRHEVTALVAFSNASALARRRRPPRFRSSSALAAIRWRWDWSLASIGQAATSRAYTFSRKGLRRNG